MTEILTAIKFIKLCAWENSFGRAVAGLITFYIVVVMSSLHSAVYTDKFSRS